MILNEKTCPTTAAKMNKSSHCTWIFFFAAIRVRREMKSTDRKIVMPAKTTMAELRSSVAVAFILLTSIALSYRYEKRAGKARVSCSKVTPLICSRERKWTVAMLLKTLRMMSRPPLIRNDAQGVSRCVEYFMQMFSLLEGGPWD